MQFISGEKLQNLCDNFVGRIIDFNSNPNILKYKQKLLNINSINNPINNNYKIFCYTDLLTDINLLISKLIFFQNSFILIFHNSDYNFNKEYLILFQKLSKLKRIYTQNINIIDERVIPLPIGLANSQWKHGDLNIFSEIYNLNIEKTNNIYFYFNKNTNKKIRNECFEILSKKLKWNIPMNFKNYLLELKKHKFAICPEGNGIDTHRFWECLYLDVIPICKKNILVEYYSTKFPIILLENWEDLDEQILLEKYERLPKIDKNLLKLNNIMLI